MACLENKDCGTFAVRQVLGLAVRASQALCRRYPGIPYHYKGFGQEMLT